MPFAPNCTRRSLPYPICYWSLDERIVYLRVDGKPTAFPVIYHDADETDCEVTIEGRQYFFCV